MQPDVAKWMVGAAAWAAMGCGNGSRECRAPAFRDEAGRCVIQCADAPGAVCDPDSGVVLGYSDASADGTGNGGGCEAGLTCDGACILPDDPNHCGGCGTVCTAPTGATAVCTQGVCDWTCDAGYERAGAGCEIAAPRLVAPLSASTVTSQRPTLRWALAAGGQGATIEVCPDRGFSDGRCQTFDAVGSSGRVASALTPGVWFWRAHGRAAGTVGSRTSAVWEFRVGARSAGDTSWGAFLDVNGDGLADVAVGAPDADGGAGRVYVFLGRAGGLDHSPQVLMAPAGVTEFGGVQRAGDVNGDGYGDLLVGAPTNEGGHAYLHLGTPAGISRTPAVEFTRHSADTHFGAPLAMAGSADIDGDGYGDIVITSANASSAYLYAGGSGGPHATEDFAISGTTSTDGFGWRVATVGDVDANGRSEFAVAASNPGLEYVRIFAGATPLSSVRAVGDIPRQNSTDVSFGALAAAAGDVNGDGVPDVLLGGVGGSAGGHAFVFRGVGSAFDPTPIVTLFDPGTGTTATGFGAAGSGGGDVNGDGFDDVVVEAPLLDRAYLYLGGAGGVAMAANVTLSASSSTSTLALTPVSNGDIDGDHFADVVLSAPGHTSTSGAIFVFPGGTAGPAAAPLDVIDGPAAGDSFGALLARWDQRNVRRNAPNAFGLDACSRSSEVLPHSGFRPGA